MAMVRVYCHPDMALQHMAPAPDSETAKRWSGTTSCGLEGDLVWVLNEQVDNAMACEACAAVKGGIRPPLDGDPAGPV